MMSLMMDEYLQDMSLHSEDISLWERHDGGLGSSTKTAQEEGKGIHLIDTYDPLTPESVASLDDDPLPDWMSEKIPLSAWLGDEEDIPASDMTTIPPSPIVTSKAEDLLNQLLVDIGVPTTMDVPVDAGEAISMLEEKSENVLMAFSPTSPLSPELSTINDPTLSQSTEPSLPQSSELDPVVAEALQSMVPGGEISHVVNLSDGGDLEEQAMALLNMLKSSTVDTSMLNTEVITINVPILQERPKVETASPPSPVSSLSEYTPSSPASSLPPSPEPVKRPSKSKPRLRISPMDKKSRKRNQNKEAATRYRIKKREEADVLHKEISGLEDINKTLKDKVESLSKEIQYLKDLLLEVTQLKGQIKSVKS